MSDMDKHQDPSVINRAHMCSCGQPTWAHEDRYCNPPRDEHDAERRNYPRTCAEAGSFCMDLCTLHGMADRTDVIVDPDCFRGPRGTERLAAWRRSREKVNDGRMFR